MSIVKSISPTLSNLIAEANFTIESVKEKILKAYYYAVEKEGYTPIEAAKLLREKLIFSKSYIREVLPIEAKDQTKTNLTLKQKKDAMLESHTTNEEEDEEEDIIKIPSDDERRKRINIQTAYDLKDAELAETTEAEEEKEKNKKFINDWYDRNLKELREIRSGETYKDGENSATTTVYESSVINNAEDLQKEIKELQTLLNTPRKGIYDVQLKDSIIPLKWEYSISKDKMVIEVDMVRARRLNIH